MLGRIGAPGDDEVLKQQVHQFRYMIPQQQVQLVDGNSINFMRRTLTLIIMMKSTLIQFQSMIPKVRKEVG